MMSSTVNIQPAHTLHTMNFHRILNLKPVSTTLCAVCFIGIASAQLPVDGKFLGNGKNAALKFVIAKEDEPFDGKPAIEIIFSEKDPAGSKEPERDAMFGKLGSTLTLRVFHDGDLFSCQVAHTALKKPSFSSSGEFKMTEFKIADGKVSGRVSTGKECEFAGDRYQADLSFTATLAKSQSKAPASSASASLTPAQKAFIDRYKKALEEKDAKTLAAFLYTEGATADTVEFFTMMQSAGTEGKIDSIELIQPSDSDMKKYNEPTEMPDGQLYKMPFIPTHQMVIVTKDGSGTSTSRLPVGEHKGKLFIPVPVPVNPSAQRAASARTMPRGNKAADVPAEQTKSQAAPAIAARSLLLPKDATDVEYKQTVNMIEFACARPVAEVAKEFAANLKEQGWKDGAGSLMGAKNAILKRELGAAKLTIMIQPVAGGCAVRIFTEGLDWSASADSTRPAPAKAAGIPSADDIGAEAARAIQDALKNLPR